MLVQIDEKTLWTLWFVYKYFTAFCVHYRDTIIVFNRNVFLADTRYYLMLAQCWPIVYDFDPVWSSVCWPRMIMSPLVYGSSIFLFLKYLCRLTLKISRTYSHVPVVYLFYYYAFLVISKCKMCNYSSNLQLQFEIKEYISNNIKGIFFQYYAKMSIWMYAYYLGL